VNALQRNFAGTARGFVQSMFTPDSDSALVRTITETMVSGSEAVGIPSTESMFEWYRDRGVAALNEIQQPMWTINSAEYVGTDVERLRQQVPRLHVTLMRGVGHFVMLEAPDEFNRHLDDAVAAVISNRGQR
jgi:pimeloyl-ACP methyl ester carboxylesterase